MKKFDLHICTIAQIRKFVSLATVQPFEIIAGNHRQQVSAKSFMGMFSLDYTGPIEVKAECSDEDFLRFHSAAVRLVAE